MIIKRIKAVTTYKPGYDDAFYEHLFAHFIRFARNADESHVLYMQAFGIIIDQNYSTDKARQSYKKALRYFKKNINVEATTRKTYRLSHVSRVRIIDILFKIAASDNRISIKELAYIESVYKLLKVTPEIFYKIKSYYIAEEEKRFNDEENNRSSSSYSKTNYTSSSLLQDACNILNININDDADTIKKAYRHLVKLNHPDMFAASGAETQEKAEEKFRVINEAYNYIKKYKNIN